jgi:hypothetical protein
MSLCGIEKEAELTISQDLLLAWLEQFRSHSDADLMENSMQLADFNVQLTGSFYPDRAGHMTMDQKSTALLESVNQTMKVSSSRVGAAMALMTSFRTQNEWH